MQPIERRSLPRSTIAGQNSRRNGVVFACRTRILSMRSGSALDSRSSWSGRRHPGTRRASPFRSVPNATIATTSGASMLPKSSPPKTWHSLGPTSLVNIRNSWIVAKLSWQENGRTLTQTRSCIRGRQKRKNKSNSSGASTSRAHGKTSGSSRRSAT